MPALTAGGGPPQARPCVKRSPRPHTEPLSTAETTALLWHVWVQGCGGRGRITGVSQIHPQVRAPGPCGPASWPQAAEEERAVSVGTAWGRQPGPWTWALQPPPALVGEPARDGGGPGEPHVRGTAGRPGPSSLQVSRLGGAALGGETCDPLGMQGLPHGPWGGGEVGAPARRPLESHSPFLPPGASVCPSVKWEGRADPQVLGRQVSAWWKLRKRRPLFCGGRCLGTRHRGSGASPSPRQGAGALGGLSASVGDPVGGEGSSPLRGQGVWLLIPVAAQ